MTGAIFTDLETFPRASKYRCLFGLAPDLLKSHHTNLNVNIIQKLLQAILEFNISFFTWAHVPTKLTQIDHYKEHNSPTTLTELKVIFYIKKMSVM